MSSPSLCSASWATLGLNGTTWALEALSLSRNRLGGQTATLDGGTELRTIIISANFFSCSVVPLDGNEKLAQGTFSEPSQQAMRNLGLQDRADFTIEVELFAGSCGGSRCVATFDLNPFGDIKSTNFSNMVMAFTGNTQLRTNAAQVPPVGPGNLLRNDR